MREALWRSRLADGWSSCLVSSSGGGVCDGRPEQRLPEGHPQREPAGGLQLLLLPLCLLLGFALRHDDSHQLVQVSPVHPGVGQAARATPPSFQYGGPFISMELRAR